MLKIIAKTARMTLFLSVMIIVSLSLTGCNVKDGVKKLITGVKKGIETVKKMVGKLTGKKDKKDNNQQVASPTTDVASGTSDGTTSQNARDNPEEDGGKKNVLAKIPIIKDTKLAEPGFLDGILDKADTYSTKADEFYKKNEDKIEDVIAKYGARFGMKPDTSTSKGCERAIEQNNSVIKELVKKTDPESQAKMNALVKENLDLEEKKKELKRAENEKANAATASGTQPTGTQ